MASCCLLAHDHAETRRRILDTPVGLQWTKSTKSDKLRKLSKRWTMLIDGFKYLVPSCDDIKWPSLGSWYQITSNNYTQCLRCAETSNHHYQSFTQLHQDSNWISPVFPWLFTENGAKTTWPPAEVSFNSAITACRHPVVARSLLQRMREVMSLGMSGAVATLNEIACAIRAPIISIKRTPAVWAAVDVKE